MMAERTRSSSSSGFKSPVSASASMEWIGLFDSILWMPAREGPGDLLGFSKRHAQGWASQFNGDADLAETDTEGNIIRLRFLRPAAGDTGARMYRDRIAEIPAHRPWVLEGVGRFGDGVDGALGATQACAAFIADILVDRALLPCITDCGGGTEGLAASAPAPITLTNNHRKPLCRKVTVKQPCEPKGRRGAYPTSDPDVFSCVDRRLVVIRARAGRIPPFVKGSFLPAYARGMPPLIRS